MNCLNLLDFGIVDTLELVKKLGLEIFFDKEISVVINIRRFTKINKNRTIIYFLSYKSLVFLARFIDSLFITCSKVCELSRILIYAPSVS